MFIKRNIKYKQLSSDFVRMQHEKILFSLFLMGNILAGVESNIGKTFEFRENTHTHTYIYIYIKGISNYLVLKR